MLLGKHPLGMHGRDLLSLLLVVVVVVVVVVRVGDSGLMTWRVVNFWETALRY